MNACLDRYFRPRYLLAVAMVLSHSEPMPAQDYEQTQFARPDITPGFSSPAAGTGQNATPLSTQQLDELLGPIALYPDPLLAQVLAAATYPMDIVQAVRFLNTSSDLSQLDRMGLDPSVQALARFPDTLKMMDQELDWTNALGTAFLNQQQDVMDAVQRLRVQARSSGALQSTPQQEVYTEEAFVGILPADPQIIYVPQYVPEVVYGWVEPPIGGYFTSISFGVGCSTGSWLNLGFNWGGRCLSYRPWPVWHGGYYRGGRGFCGTYYNRIGWGSSWHRRSGSSLPRFCGGPNNFRGGRGFGSLRSGFGNRPSGGGFANRQGGSRDGIGNGRRGDAGAGFGNGPRAGLGRGGTGSGFGNGTRGGERNGGLASPRSGGADRGGLPGDARSNPRNRSGNAEFGGGQRNGAESGNRNYFGNRPSVQRDNRSPDAPKIETGKRGAFGGFDRNPREGRPSDSRDAGRSTRGEDRGGLLNRGRPDRDGGMFGLQGGDRSHREGRNLDSSFGGSRSSGTRAMPRAFDGGSSGGGREFSRGSPQRSYGGGGSPSRGFGSGATRDAGRMPGFSGGGRSSGGSAYRGGGSNSSGPRMESRSGGMSMRSSGNRSSGGGMRSSGMGGGGRGGRGGGGRGR